MQPSSLASSFFRFFKDNFKDVVGRLRYFIGRLLFHRCTIFMIFERFCKTFYVTYALLFVASSHRSSSSPRLSRASKSSAVDQPSREDQKYTG